MSSCWSLKHARAALFGVACALLFSVPGSLLAQEEQKYPEFRFEGQFRLRSEADGRTAGVNPDFATLSRVRLGVRATLLDWMSVFAQLQDARAWGSETNTLLDASAEFFDLHQGYVDLGSTDAFTARLGRQKMYVADERLVGAVEWVNTARPFDGARGFGEAGEFSWNVWVMNVVERDSLLPTGLHPQANQGLADDGWLIGGFASRKFGDVNSEFTFVFDRKAATPESYTANLRFHGRSGIVLYEAAGGYQFGPDRSAFFASGKAGVSFGKGMIAAQLDYLSGDSDPADADTKAFNTLYATNHKFYGYMDYFLFIPQQLDQAGLVDAMLRGSLNTSAKTTVRLDVHRFALAKERSGQKTLGTELDLTGQWRIAPPVSLQLGFSVYVPEDLSTIMLPAFAAGDDVTYWGYAQLLVRWP
jgi:hypothetical protein